MPDPGPALSILIVPEGSRSTRTFRLSQSRLRLLILTVTLVAVSLAVMVGSWWYLAARASRVTGLETQIQELTNENARVGELGVQLEALEARYAHIASLFGVSADSAAALWLPPPTTNRSRSADSSQEGRPGSWPLTERGFVTQALLADTTGGHPGLDIAVPTGSYIRASGSGTVAEVGEDPIYGLYVIVDHADGYQTVYAHTSEILVANGDPVLRNEVIALSGSTGRSTAPHLHFEVLRNGEAVDPLTVVRQP